MNFLTPTDKALLYCTRFRPKKRQLKNSNYLIYFRILNSIVSIFGNKTMAQVKNNAFLNVRNILFFSNKWN